MAEASILSSLKGLNINKILNTANKTINFVNKAIPMYKEIKPTIGNLKKAFSKEEAIKVYDEIKESRPIKIKKNVPNNIRNNNTLTFFQ